MSLLTTRKFLAGLVSAAEGELERLGFRKAGRAYLCPIDDGTFGWLGLNTISRRGDGRVGINPVVGVVCLPIETALSDLSSVKEPVGRPTLGTSLGYVTPDVCYQEWLFEPTPFDYRTEVSRMVSAVERYGVPFMRENASLERIISNLEQLRFTSKESVAFRLPIGYALSGRPGLALAYVLERIREIADRSDISAQRYKDFATRFLDRF